MAIHEFLERARALYGNVQPCGRAETWEDCITIADGDMVFWFDDMSGSTHIIIAEGRA